MKTPKRHHELSTLVHICTEKVWDFSQEQVNAQRWKRKNHIARLKNKIARLTAKNKWLSEERLKYINYYFNSLSHLVELMRGMEERSTAKHRKETEQ